MHMKDIFPELRPMDISNLLRELKEEGKIMHVGVKEVRKLAVGLNYILKGLFRLQRLQLLEISNLIPI